MPAKGLRTIQKRSISQPWSRYLALIDARAGSPPSINCFVNLTASLNLKKREGEEAEEGQNDGADS